ncbi:hypothetical protein PT974_03025 [Cladobotryum mycophilum]|uniref:ADP-ribosylglycohydrolase n=1 Tax=Cladobotryum mycophilum TaxID=491253 RepID=A0ABR0SWX4_9HYPO
MTAIRSPIPTPPDYLERVYAGVVGKLIGVYLGRPFEGWTHQDILAKIGPIHNYVHERVGAPLVVTDDDVSGTFTFVRALAEHPMGDRQRGEPVITSEQIGKTWLNNIVERHSTLWWGGKGISTEHTAYLNLKHGIPAPRSGSIATNGRTVAEQIGAQIFIDGWALVSPGQPDLAAELAETAGRVSHDGESVHAAKVWAAMEAEAFVSNNVDHLLDTGLQYVPKDSLIAKVIGEVRVWSKADNDWMATRQRIEDTYGYDKFHGWCHVIPNHAIMIMSLIYGAYDFHEAMHIVNTCGWDTDCNSGNLACLLGIMHGITVFEGGVDWRGPIADRALVSGGDNGYSINNAARIAIDIANLGHQLAGEKPLEPPKDGAQFHFTLPGSVQGFQATATSTTKVSVEQLADGLGRPGLAVRLSGLWKESGSVEVVTPTFAPKEVRDMDRIYQLMASPLIYPGQRVSAAVRSAPENTAPVKVCLRLRVYDDEDLVTMDSESSVVLEPGAEDKTLAWTIPDDMDSQPIESIGIAVFAVDKPMKGIVWLDNLRWDGVPTMTLQRPKKNKMSDFWKRAWVSNVDHWHHWVDPAVCIAHDKGEGIVSYGTREWTDYRITVLQFKATLDAPAGIAIRVQGINRYYALMFNKGQKSISIVKALDEKRLELAQIDFEWELDAEYEVSLEVKGPRIIGCLGDMVITAEDSQYTGGGLGFVVTDGSLIAGSIKIAPAS